MELEKLLSVSIVYVNKKRKVEGILKTNVELENTTNELRKENLVKLIGTYNNYKHKPYIILDVMRYNVLLKNKKDCVSFMKREDEWLNNFVTTGWKYSNDMAWDETIEALKPLNTLVLLFIEKQNANAVQNKSKRINPHKKKTKRVAPLSLT
jgi:hypothetical protein